MYAGSGYTLRYMEAWVDIWGTHTPTLMEWGTFLGFLLAQATLEVIEKTCGGMENYYFAYFALLLLELCDFV